MGTIGKFAEDKTFVLQNGIIKRKCTPAAALSVDPFYIRANCGPPPEYSNEWREITETLFDISHSQTLRKIESSYQVEGVLTSEQKDILKQILFFLTEVRESLEAPSIRILLGGESLNVFLYRIKTSENK